MTNINKIVSVVFALTALAVSSAQAIPPVQPVPEPSSTAAYAVGVVVIAALAFFKRSRTSSKSA